MRNQVAALAHTLGASSFEATTSSEEPFVTVDLTLSSRQPSTWRIFTLREALSYVLEQLTLLLSRDVVRALRLVGGPEILEYDIAESYIWYLAADAAWSFTDSLNLEGDELESLWQVTYEEERENIELDPVGYFKGQGFDMDQGQWPLHMSLDVEASAKYLIDQYRLDYFLHHSAHYDTVDLGDNTFAFAYDRDHPFKF